TTCTLAKQEPSLSSRNTTCLLSRTVRTQPLTRTPAHGGSSWRTLAILVRGVCMEGRRVAPPGPGFASALQRPGAHVRRCPEPPQDPGALRLAAGRGRARRGPELVRPRVRLQPPLRLVRLAGDLLGPDRPGRRDRRARRF